MKKLFIYSCTGVFLLYLFTSCAKNSQTDIISYQLVGRQATISIDKVKKEVNILFPESTTSAYPVAATFTLSDGATAYVSDVLQASGKSYNNYEIPLSYTIKAENGTNSAIWKVVSVNNSVTVPWGLGDFQQESRLINKSYPWYLDQKNTGTYSSINCGPTATTMAAKWSSPTFTKTPLDARAAYGSAGGWWSTTDIHNYLLDNGIPHTFYYLSTTSEGTQNFLKLRIDNSNIVILCLDISYVRDGPRDDRRVDRYYNSAVGSGHFIIVKGYRKVAGTVFFEIYDPWSWGAIYSTGELKGIDRYYRAEDLFAATSTWWNNAIVISPKGAKSEYVTSQDISAFPVGWGR